MHWVVDFVGPLKKAKGNKEYLIVATRYLSKWIEVDPLSRITGAIQVYNSLASKLQNGIRNLELAISPPLRDTPGQWPSRSFKQNNPLMLKEKSWSKEEQVTRTIVQSSMSVSTIIWKAATPYFIA